MSDRRMPKRCGNCKYHLYDDADGGCVCVNEGSEAYMTYTEHADSCEKWEKKQL